jgi:sigma-B regulation protein RsbU (phosphoserine phosphatase)
VLGVIPEAGYESEVLDLRKGDLLILYTDGLVEAENSEGEFYSVQRLAAMALAHMCEPAEKIAEAIYTSVTEFRGNSLLDDDATLVVIKVL